MLLLTEQDVQELFPMPRAIERVEAAFHAQHGGEATNHNRQRIFLPHCALHYMAAGLPGENLLGLKIYTTTRETLRFLVLLYDGASGGLLAMIEADYLGRIRTGAASGVATRLLARSDASRAGVIGTGRQARTQLEAVAVVRRLGIVRVFGRDEQRRQEFCRAMSDQLHLDVRPAASAEEVARSSDILITATAARQPVLQGEWIAPGTHINAVGANMTSRRELDDAALSRSSVIAVDSIAQAREEAGDLVMGEAAMPGGWSGVTELSEIIAGVKPGRQADADITLFKSTGIALWDVASAGYIYKQAIEKGKGRKVPVWGE